MRALFHKQSGSHHLRLAFIAGALIVACTTPPPLPNKRFKYWAMVQEMRDGQEYKDPSKSNDNATFDNGDKMQLNVEVAEAGYLYVFNEGSSEPDNNFRLIYPKKDTNNGSAAIGANQTVQSEWILFQGPPGSENFWIVWSVSPVRELDVVKNEALSHPEGALSERSLVPLREFLKALQSRVASRAWRFKKTNDTVVRGKTDILVFRAEFKHQ